LLGKKADSGATNKKGAMSSSRGDEVAAALKEIEQQMERHYLDSETEKRLMKGKEKRARAESQRIPFSSFPSSIVRACG